MVATYNSDKEPQKRNYLGSKLVKPLTTLGAVAISLLTNGCYAPAKHSNEKQPMAMHAPVDSIDSLIAYKQDEQPQDSPEPKADPQDPPEQESYLGTTPEEKEIEKEANALYRTAVKRYEDLETVDDKVAGEISDEFVKAHLLYKKAEAANPDNEVYSDFIKNSHEWAGTVKYQVVNLTEEQRGELDKYIASYQEKTPTPPPAPQTTEPQEEQPATPPKPAGPPKINKHPLRFGLHDGARGWTEYTRASRKSSEIDRVNAGLSVDYGAFGLDVLGHWNKDKWRDAASNDRIIEDGNGAYFNGRIWVLEGSVAMSEDTRKRTSHDQNVTTDPNFIITDTTRAVETLENEYKAGRGAIRLGKFKPGMTLWESTDNLNVDATTIVDIINRNDPAGNNTSTINTNIANEITTKGFQPSLFYYEDAARFGGIFDYRRIEIDGPDRKIEEYGVTALADLAGKNDAWALSVAAGRRWVDNSESNRKFDPVHGYANAAADLEQLIGVPDTTAFASFWRRSEPGAGGGFVFGDNAVPMIMNYRNETAWKELEFMNHMGPEERNVYLRMMQHHLVRDLGADNKMRLLLFGGADRSTVNGKQEWNAIGEGVFTIPLIKDFATALYTRVEDDGTNSLYEAGVYLGPVKFGAGTMEEEGVKDDKFPFLKIGLDFDF